jgi:ribosomal protein L40E
MPDEDDLIDYEPCSYCGAKIPADIVRCPKCGNFTDGAGPKKAAGAGPGWDRKKIVMVVVAVVTLAAFLLTSLRGC